MPKLTIKDILDAKTDFGKEKPDAPMAERERLLAAVTMAANAAFVQLTLEGMILPGQEIHYQIHFMDFLNRLWKGDEINFGQSASQTLKVESKVGEVFAEAVDSYLTSGTAQSEKIREAIHQINAEAEADENKQTNKDEQNERPKYLN